MVFTLVDHPFLGLVLEPHIVQVNSKGAFTLTHQRVFSRTADYFSKNINHQELELIRILDEVDDDHVFKKFNTETKKKIRTSEFFTKYCNDKLKEEKIRPYLEERINKALQQLRGETIYKTGNDNNPTSVKIEVGAEPANIWFHFKNNPEGIRYYPTLRYKNEKVEFMYKGAQVVCKQPAWLLVQNQLLDFDKGIDGKKLQPFLNKRYIQIPKNAEENYLQKFVTQLVEKYDVKADCFGIETVPAEGSAFLNMQQFFDPDVALKLQYDYNGVVFDYGSDQQVMAKLERVNDHYVFRRTVRKREWEEHKRTALERLGLQVMQGPYFNLKTSNKTRQVEGLLSIDGTNKYDFLEWLNEHHQQLKNNGITVVQGEEKNKYFIGSREIKIEVKEQSDWFDVQATVKFGDYSFSFLALKEYILKGKREFTLPNGMIAVIPEEWFGNLSGILEFSAGEDEIKLERHHIGLLEELAQQGGKYLRMSDKLEKLRDYGQIREMDMPEQFHGTLRAYQKAGFDWFYFLKENAFGGCLADDMGLGKTIQTLTLIQKEKELYQSLVEAQPHMQIVVEPTHQPKQTGTVSQISLFDPPQPSLNRSLYYQTGGIGKTTKSSHPNSTYIRCSLIIVPNSLVYNWFHEAKKFTPNLRVLVYTGINRNKNAAQFIHYDLIISTYGTVRVDIDILKEFKFNYLILDESQAIKNPNSQSSKAVKTMRASHKLVLTGTPIENSVQELWSQLSFINPGLLGSLSSFTEKFVVPIEKAKDVHKMRQLKAIIKPFILRRTKDQVAKELPPKMEQVVYCEMGDEQREAYEKVKSHYRNEIMKALREMGINKTQFTLLQGLTKLRQIANHPLLVNPDFEGECGKFKEVTYMAETAFAEGHKVLIFSQFVSQLAIYVDWFKARGLDFCYLDGSMNSNARQEMVNRFQTGKVPFFLISLKAGGFGLNLTEADYVFMIDPWWNPAVERQAIDRAHRIGQNKNVFIYKFISRDTVEEKILELQHKKRVLADNLIETDEAVIKHIDVDEMLELLN